MLQLAVLSLVLALISALLTFSGLLGGAEEAGRVFFIVFLVSFIITAAIAAVRCRPSA